MKRYDSAASLVSVLKLAVAAFVRAGAGVTFTQMACSRQRRGRCSVRPAQRPTRTGGADLKATGCNDAIFSNLMKWGVARFAEASGARLVRPDGMTLSIPYVLSSRISLRRSSPALLTVRLPRKLENTVTVTAAARGILGNATKNGYRIYYPGSPSIPPGGTQALLGSMPTQSRSNGL